MCQHANADGKGEKKAYDDELDSIVAVALDYQQSDRCK